MAKSGINLFGLSSIILHWKKGAMNAAGVYKLCNGGKKCPNFFFFHRPKAEQRP
jgi:hypothetical protein